MSTPPLLTPTSLSGLRADPIQAMPASARLVLRLLQNLSVGTLAVTFPDGSCARFGGGEPSAEIVLANWNVCEASLRHGDIGFGQTYIAGDWRTSNLSALLQVMVANRNQIEAVIHGRWWGRLIYRVRHLMRRNSRTGSRRNIHAHYDIGNPFYPLWRSPTITSSSALFSALPGQGDDGNNLADAQRAKYHRILERLKLPDGADILEIGCGWGGFAETAVGHGYRLTGLTLSGEQLDYANQRMERAGLGERADLRLMDYRDCHGQFDGIASIEMFEAVGEAYWSNYFACLKRNLKPRGRAVIQTITIDERLFANYRKSSDFIQQYIFPGGMLPSGSRFEAEAARAGLRVTDAFAFGQDYARTLHVWLDAVNANEGAIMAQGFDQEFLRTWTFYLAYCEAAFRYGNTNVVQYTLEHSR